MSRPAAIYARVSSQSQDTKDPWASLPAQVKTLQALAEMHGLDVIHTAQEVISGAKAERPEFDHIMGMVREGAVKAVLVVDFTRLTRTEKLGDFEAIKATFRKARCSLVMPGQVYEFQTADEDVVTDIHAVMSKAERLRIKARTHAGSMRKARAGGWVGHRVPYGYLETFDPVTGERRFEPHPVQAPIVARIFAEFVGGRPLNAIRQWLDAEGLAPPGSGAHWYPNTIAKMLENPTYVGLIQYGRTRGYDEPAVPSRDFPALVSAAIYEAAQHEKAVRRVRSPRGPKPPAPLSGILRCQVCGCGMTINRNKVGSYYRCSDYKGDAKVICAGSPTLNVGLCHALVLDHLKSALVPYLDESRLRKLKQPAAADMGAARRRELERTIARQQKKQADLLDWALESDLPKAMTTAKINAIEDAIRAARDEIAKLGTEKPALAPALTTVQAKALAAGLEAITPEHPRLREVFERSILQATLRLVRGGRGYRQQIEVVSLQLRTGEWV